MEASNVQKMWDALNSALVALFGWQLGQTTRSEHKSAIEKIKAALALPLRNCDVGTAEDQAERFGKLCCKHYNEEGSCNDKCPLASLPIIYGFPRCQAYWAQMPYEEGGAE